MSHEAPAVNKAEDGVEFWSRVQVAGVEYLRHPVPTRWFREADELVWSLHEHIQMARPGDTVAVSEKVAVLLTGRAVGIETVPPGRLARVLARYVRPRTDSRGLSVPEKMEYVVRTIGCARVIAAAVGGAMTRPLGVRGAFYLLAGSVARDIDGGVRHTRTYCSRHSTPRPRRSSAPIWNRRRRRRRHRRPQRLRRVDPRCLPRFTAGPTLADCPGRQSDGPALHRDTLRDRPTA